MSFSKEYRCGCGKLLFKSEGFNGTVEVKCKRCHSVKTFIGETLLLRDSPKSYEIKTDCLIPNDIKMKRSKPYTSK